MTPEKWLSDKIKEKGIKQRFIAEKIGISEQAFSFSMTGRRNLQTEEFLAACDAIGEDPREYFSLKKEEAAANA
jgi:transcriptional regulator with XRE-family HTH domain